MSQSLTHFFVRGPCALLRGLVLVAGVALTCSVALAQTVGPPRVDEPPLQPGGGEWSALWKDVQIPLLSAGASLGAMWTNDPTQLYVWSTDAPGTVVGNASVTPRSRLLHWDGTSWSAVLEVTGETGLSVYGNCKNDVFAATSTVGGLARMYHFNGVAWTEQALPAGTTAPAGDIAGKLDDVYFRSGPDVLRQNVGGWQGVVSPEDAPLRALAYVGPNEIYVPCCTGHCHWDGAFWGHHDCGSFLNVASAWGIRQNADAKVGMSTLCVPPLSMYAVGRSPVTNGFTLWRFVEEYAGAMQGEWVTVPLGFRETTAQPAGSMPDKVPENPGDPPIGGDPVLPGDGVAVWGTSATDVYAAGTESGSGVLYHFDGVVWRLIKPLADMPPIADVWGSGPGDVWVSFTDGHLMHYIGGITNPNPGGVAPGTPAVLPGAPASGPAMTGVFAMLETRVVRAGNGVVTLEYAVPGECEVSISAFDVAGRCAAVIERGRHSAGRYQVDWSTAGLARGIYFCRVTAGGSAVSQRVLVLD